MANCRENLFIGGMDLNLFDYDLPEYLIAQEPAEKRSGSRLLVLDRVTGAVNLTVFSNLPKFLRPGDCLVVNNTKVFKARLIGRKESGGEVEIFLVRPVETSACRWRALAQPSRRLKEGMPVLFGPTGSGGANLALVESLGEGSWIVEFGSYENQDRIIERFGHIPLPQYIKRQDNPVDLERYQTVFAHPDRQGAVAAPTAGFHFTPELIEEVKSAGVEVVELTLHVGPGTFKPVSVDRIEDHSVDPEFACLTPEAADIINKTREQGGRIIPVGTTSVRTLESAPVIDGRLLPFEGEVDLYIRPGYQFKFADNLITNFHLPKSSLLILVSAFAGRERVLNAYKTAIQENFRFYSYGDAMLILSK